MKLMEDARFTGTNKLRAKYVGRFAISRKVSATAYELDLPLNIRVHPVINLEYLKEYHTSPERFAPQDMASALVMVKELMSSSNGVNDDKRIHSIRNHTDQKNGTRQYLVHYEASPDHPN
jgi:hypothetical protein